MVFQPCLTIAPSDPATSQEIETGDDNGNSANDADGMSRFTETACLIDT